MPADSTSPKPGDAFYIDNDDHLWVLISDPGQYPDRVVAATLVSHTEEGSLEALFDAGDHPFVTKPTCIDPRISQLATSRGISLAVRSWHQVRFSKAQLQKIVRHICASEEFSIEVWNAIDDQYGCDGC